MFSKDSILYEVNIIVKIISLFIVLISIIVCNENLVLILLACLIFLVSLEFPVVKILSALTLILSAVTIFYAQYLWILKLLIFILYTILLKKVTKVKELRYLLELTLYKFQSAKVTYMFLYNIYFVKYFKNNILGLLELKKSYGFKGSMSSYQNMLVLAYRKTRQEIKELILINNLRFYNISKKRTYYEAHDLEIWDICYILIHVLLLIIIFILAFWR